MTSEEIVDSITWHYLCTDGLALSQLQEHQRRGACPACEDAAPLVLATKVPDLSSVPLGVLAGDVEPSGAAFSSAI